MARKKKMDPLDIAAQQREREQAEVEQAFLKGMTTLRDLIAPSSLEIHSAYFRIGTKYGRTMYVYGYPRRLYTGWLSGLINIDQVLDISMFIYPVDTAIVLKNLRKKVTQLEADMAINAEKGKTRIHTERERLMRTYERMKSEIQTYENNLGFLNISSKGGSGLLKEMERKLERLREEMALVVKKIEAIDENLE